MKIKQVLKKIILFPIPIGLILAVAILSKIWILLVLFVLVAFALWHLIKSSHKLW